MRLKAVQYLAAILLSAGGLAGAQSASATSLSFTFDSDPAETLGTLDCSACSALVFSGNLSQSDVGTLSWDGSAGEFFDLSLPYFTGVSDPLADLSATAAFASTAFGTSLTIDSAATTTGGGGVAQSSSADAVLLNLGDGTGSLYALLRNDAPSGGAFTFTWMGQSTLGTRSILASFTELNVTELPTTSPVRTSAPGTGSSNSGTSNTGTGSSQGISPVPLPLTGLLLLSGLGGLALTRRKALQLI